MKKNIGKKYWAIAEGYIPGTSHGPAPQMTSHEAICILNASEKKALIKIIIYYSDREPVGPYQFEIPARRTKHIRFNHFSDPEPIPFDTDFSSVIESNVPIVVQHTRLDSRQAENALLSTIAYPCGD
ncbi:MAG: sensory rhodopsin transducer [Verrucomicrobiae bacterium]|nr:sensory rhodopsin transducer [Verrucomicrobiae bacterium]